MNDFLAQHWSLYWLEIKVKGKIYLYIATCAHTPSSAALLSQTGPPFSLGGLRLSPHTLTLTSATIQLHVVLFCHLNGLHLCSPYKFMDNYSFTVAKGMEG